MAHGYSDRATHSLIAAHVTNGISEHVGIHVPGTTGSECARSAALA